MLVTAGRPLSQCGLVSLRIQRSETKVDFLYLNTAPESNVSRDDYNTKNVTLPLSTIGQQFQVSNGCNIPSIPSTLTPGPQASRHITHYGSKGPKKATSNGKWYWYLTVADDEETIWGAN